VQVQELLSGHTLCGFRDLTQERNFKRMSERNFEKELEIRGSLWKRCFFLMTEEGSEGYERVDHVILNSAA